MAEHIGSDNRLKTKIQPMMVQDEVDVFRGVARSGR